MIHLTLRQLEYFAAAVRHGGAAQGAAALNVSQPSVSKAIADLESLWGQRLFVRLHARGLEPTPAGIERHRLVSALLEQARALEAKDSSVISGTLAVGCLTTLAPRYLPAMLSLFNAAFPQIHVQVHEGDTEWLTRQLERGALEVALMYDLGLARSVRVERVADLWPYALLPWHHRLAKRNSVSLAELAREPLILINLPHSREYFLSLFRAAGSTPDIAGESASLEMVRSMVANGLGVSVLTTRPPRDYSYDGKRLTCRRLRGTMTPQHVALAYPAGQTPPNGAVAAFSRLVRSQFAKIGTESAP